MNQKSKKVFVVQADRTALLFIIGGILLLRVKVINT
jgi:hypothetical protein